MNATSFLPRLRFALLLGLAVCGVGFMVWQRAHQRINQVAADPHRERAAVASLAAAAPTPPTATPKLKAAADDDDASASKPLNDAAYGGRAADLMPLLPTTSHLLSADISITEDPLADAWQIIARYSVENRTAQPIALPLLFPEELCQPDVECTESGGSFSDVVTIVDGKEVTARPAPAAAARLWSKSPGHNTLYELALAPQQKTQIVHQYKLARSRGNDWSELRYLSSAGRWAAPVESVRFQFRLARPVLYAMYSRSYRLTRFAETFLPTLGGTAIELALIAKSLATRTDLSFVLPANSINGAAPDQGMCPGFDGHENAATLRSTLQAYPPELLRGCRNQVYALHGYPFQDAALRAMYYGSPPPLPPWASAQEYAISGRPENHDFKDAWLSPGERAYVAAVAAAEHRSRKP